MRAATVISLISFVKSFPAEKIPGEVMHLAKRCLMNYCGVALYGSRDPSVNVLLELFADQGSPPQARVIGRHERLSQLDAALLNGYEGHVEDYDDTHPTVIHPSSPIFPAPIVCFMSFRFMKRTHKIWHWAYRRRSHLFSLLGNVLPGVRVVKAFVQEDRERERFTRRSEAYMDANINAARVFAGFNRTTGFVMAMSSLTIWGYGGYLVISQWSMFRSTQTSN